MEGRIQIGISLIIRTLFSYGFVIFTDNLSHLLFLALKGISIPNPSPQLLCRLVCSAFNTHEHDLFRGFCWSARQSSLMGREMSEELGSPGVQILFSLLNLWLVT